MEKNRRSNLNREAYELAQDWIRWLDSRKLFGAPPSHRSLLGKLSEGSRNRGEPNAQLSAEIAAFHLAVCGLEIDYFVPFVVVYCDFSPDNKPVKSIAADMDIDRSTFYRRADQASAVVVSATRKLVLLHSSMRREIAGLI